MNAFEQLQKVYESEINFTIESLWDAGFGSEAGRRSQRLVAQGEGKTLADAAQMLSNAAKEHFPESQYALTAPGIKKRAKLYGNKGSTGSDVA
jgi:hypothetical protein